jgi:hypothetical protein
MPLKWQSVQKQSCTSVWAPRPLAHCVGRAPHPGVSSCCLRQTHGLQPAVNNGSTVCSIIMVQRCSDGSNAYVQHVNAF